MAGHHPVLLSCGITAIADAAHGHLPRASGDAGACSPHPTAAGPGTVRIVASGPSEFPFIAYVNGDPLATASGRIRHFKTEQQAHEAAMGALNDNDLHGDRDSSGAGAGGSS